MSIFERAQQDHVGKWFEQRRKLGVSDTIYWARYTPETDGIKMHEFQHANGDGMSIMKYMLSELGYEHVEIPTCKELGIPSKQQLKKIKANIRPHPKKMNWLFWQADRQIENNSINTFLFNRDETARIRQRARDLNIPLTALVFSALNVCAAEKLMHANQEYTWFYPVNLRGAVQYGSPYANYSSGFYLSLNKDVSVHDLQQRIRKKLKSGEHWVNWQQANITKYLPGIAIRWIYRFISKRYFYAGNFSAMGDWLSAEDGTSIQSVQDENITKERWFCSAPGTKNYPISACMLTWNDQLTITLKLHPSIVRDKHTSIETICAWGENLLEGVVIIPEEAKQQRRIISFNCSG